MALISAAILGYNWFCVVSYWRAGKAPGFAHIYGGLPVGAAIALGWLPVPKWLFWIPFFMDPGGGLYLLGFIRYALTSKD